MDTPPVFSAEDESCDIVFSETLELVATLYKSKSKGTFQEKPACLVVRIKKKGGRKGQMYQGMLLSAMVGAKHIVLKTFLSGY